MTYLNDSFQSTFGYNNSSWALNRTSHSPSSNNRISKHRVTYQGTIRKSRVAAYSIVWWESCSFDFRAAYTVFARMIYQVLKRCAELPQQRSHSEVRIAYSEYRIAYDEYRIPYTVYFYVNSALGPYSDRQSRTQLRSRLNRKSIEIDRSYCPILDSSSSLNLSFDSLSLFTEQ